MLHFDASLEEEEGSAADEVGERLVSDRALLDSSAQRLLDHILASKLDRRRQHVELTVPTYARAEVNSAIGSSA